MKNKKQKMGNKLGFGHLMLWKSSEITSAWVNMIALTYLSIYASDILGLNTAIVGTLLLVSKLIDAVTDFAAGWLVDNTNTKIGRGRPYEICIVGMTICTILMFGASPQWSKTIKCFWVVSMYILSYAVFGTLRNAAQNVYTIRHFKGNREHISKQAAFGSIVVMAASIAVSVIFPILMAKLGTSSSGWTTMVSIILVPGLLIGVLRFVFCKEYVPEGETEEVLQEKTKFSDIVKMLKQNKYLWIYSIAFLAYSFMTNLSIGAYYFTYVIGNIGLAGILSVLSIVVLPAMVFVPALIKKVGSVGKTIFLTSWIGVAGYVICFFANKNIAVLLVGTLLGTMGTLPIMYYGSIFIMDICTYNEIKGLPRMEGSASAVSNFISKLGSAMGSWITGVLLLVGGYISSVGGETVTQPASAIMMMRVIYAFIPLICTLAIGFSCKCFANAEIQARNFEEGNAK